jgi:hypothetical protein
MTVDIPHFAESDHQLIQSLFHHSDRSLLTLFQQHRDQGRYFTAIFCRYSPIVYTLIANTKRSPQETNYLFALTWREVFHSLDQLVLRENGSPEVHSLQNWLIYMSVLCLNQKNLKPDTVNNYDLKTAPPPLWCYLEEALEKLPAKIRFILVMSELFNWSTTRITAYLQADGENISPTEVEELLEQGYRMLTRGIPEDIRLIYEKI